MASHIAHYFFGKRILTLLPDAAQAVAQKYEAHFLIGNQGPDIFFFALPYRADNLGSRIHAESLSKLLRQNRGWIRYSDRNNPTWAYLLGLLCHFSLDISLHPFIDRIEDRVALDHMTMERELDRAVLEEEGIDPLRFVSRDILPHPDKVADAIVPVYGRYEGGDIHAVRSALFSFRLVEMLFHVSSPGAYDRKMRLLRLLGMQKSFGGKLMHDKGFFESRYITTPALMTRMRLAYPVAVEAIEALYEGEDAYPPFFDLNFSGV